MKKTTVVFDLDGTLLDTLQDLANAVNYALEQQGMPKRTLEEVRCFVGNGVRQSKVKIPQIRQAKQKRKIQIQP